MIPEECGHGHQDPWRAETALEAMRLAEGGLQRIQLAVDSQSFDRGDHVPVDLDREHEAGANGCAIEEDRAGAAHTVLAPDMGAGKTGVVTEKVGQEQP
jgi:hypothetical protein